MTAPYTPTTHEVREAWWRDQCPKHDLDFDDIYRAAFDRWLIGLLEAERDKTAEVAAERIDHLSLQLAKVTRERDEALAKEKDHG